MLKVKRRCKHSIQAILPSILKTMEKKNKTSRKNLHKMMSLDIYGFSLNKDQCEQFGHTIPAKHNAYPLISWDIFSMHIYEFTNNTNNHDKRRKN
jgi:hypothetical protein